MISFALENPADFFGETFYLNLRNSTRIDLGEQSFFNKNFDHFGIGSYTITAEDTLHPHKLLTAKVLNISNFKDITELKGMTEIIASVEYIGDGRIKKSPKFSHTRNSDYYLDYVSGIAVTDKLYLNGFGLPKPIIRMRLIDCYQDFDTTTISACDSCNFHGETYFESGIYTKKYTNVDGCDSLSTLKLSVSKSPRDTIYETVCGPFTWNDSVYMKSGIYHQIFKSPTPNRCDSVATLFLSINAFPDTSISVVNNVLTTKAQNATLQWLNCDKNFMPIEGETFSFFAPETEGDYALELETTEGCKDTSACYTIQFNNSIKPFKTEDFNVYPNPNHGRFELKGLDEIQTSNFPLTLLIFNSQGERVWSKQIEHRKTPIQTKLSSGVYILQIVTPNTIYTRRMVVYGR